MAVLFLRTFAAAMMFARRFRLLAFVPLLLAAACGTSYQVAQHSSVIYNVKDTSPDSSLYRLVQPYKEELDKKMSEVIGRADTTLTKKQPECTLGNFMADAQLAAARELYPDVTVSVSNYGGIRVSYLQEGPVMLRHMYELMPFDNTLVILELPGTVLVEFCQHMASLKGWPVSGLSYTIKDKKAVNIKVNGQAVKEDALYKVATSDYVANGGDNCHFLKAYKPVLTNIFVRDVLIAYVRNRTASGQALSATLENRVTNE
ncbi:MAG: 5'-nucleotidase C-terminal domain-containing protein [Flavipsychrobacter sp.]|nr:5'-nucleotidase C-terminal domain-containing protein [Flavipsychrobacter sp.]